MANSLKCSRCGSQLTPDSPGGHCLPCLLLLGIHSEEPNASEDMIRESATDLSGWNEKVGDRIGRYKILEQIGEGGCGVVYLAEQQEPVRRQVALKVIKLGMDTRQVVARFEAERQALAMMDHPNIAKVFDAGATDSGRPFFVMELVKGIPIPHYCDQERLSTRERLDLFIGVCQAIQHAHQKGIIHRDIKPSNILVSVQEGKPVPKVIDFGIAKATQQKLTEKTLHTQWQQFIGTPAYMSPEQAQMSPDPSGDIDTRSDVYSLGVLLYELLVGKTPFDAKEMLAAGLEGIRRTILEKEPARPSTRLSMMGKDELTTTTERRGAEAPKLIYLLRGDLDWIVMKCLEKDRTRRYETANGLAADLQRHLDNEPVVARPPSTGYRFQKAWRRNRFVFTGAAVIAVTLVVGIGVSTWQAIEASSARNGEKEQRFAAQAERDKAQTEQRRAQAAQKEAEQARKAEKQERQRAEGREAEVSHLLYVANMNLVQQAWDQNNAGRVRELLTYTATNAERGFEWYYWQRQIHRELRTLRGHTYGVYSVAFSPDGQRLVTGSHDHTAKVWDVASGKVLLTLNGHAGNIYSAAFSPDGQRIATGSGDRTAKVWDASSGEEILTLKGHDGSFSSVAFSPNGRSIVTGSADLYTASEDHTAKVWDAANGSELLTIKGHDNGIWCVAFSRDGQRIATASWDGTAKVWDAANGKELHTLKGHSAEVNSVAISSDGLRIVTVSNDQTAKVWDAASGKELVTLKGHGAAVNSVAFFPDGQRILTGSDDQTARVWDAASGKEMFTLKGHSSLVMSVAVSPDGQRIATASGDWMSATEHTVKVWDAAAPKEPLTLIGHTKEVMSAGFSRDGRRIVTGSSEGTARVWETASGRELLGIKAHSNVVNSVAFSPEGERIVTGSEDDTAKVWEVASGKELFTLEGHSKPVRVAVFSPEGQRIATASWDGTAKIWDAATGKNLLTLDVRSGRVWSVAFAPDGRRVVTGSDGATKVWDVASGKVLLALKGWSYGVAVSPDGLRIASSSPDRTAKIWDVTNGKELLTLKGHQEQVDDVAFSPDGERIVTASRDRTAKVWDAATGEELLTLKGHSGLVIGAAFSPDGQRILTGSWDYTAKVWQTATALQVAGWLAEERPTAFQEGAIKRWLILAPVPLTNGQRVAEGLNSEQIEGERGLRPRAEEVASIGSGKLKWRAVALQNYVIDFNAILGQETTQSVAYAVCYIRSETERRGLQMLVGSDDGAKVYLNGKEVLKVAAVRELIEDQDTVSDITLNAGVNVLVFKVVNETSIWQGCIRFTDARGNPVDGISVTLDPEGKDQP